MERQIKFQKTAARGDHAPMRSPRPSSHANRLLKLQRSIGNQATQRLIRSPYIQAKLEVSNPDDPLEQEADRTAETVMRMPDSDVGTRVQAKPLSTQISRVAQDTKTPDEEEEMVAAKSHSHVPLAVREDDDEEEQVVNRKDGNTTGTPTAGSTVTNAAATNIHALNGGGPRTRSDLKVGITFMFTSRTTQLTSSIPTVSNRISTTA